MDTIDQIRAFNRFYTRKIGILDLRDLGDGLSLSELNILYELAQPDPPTARILAKQLRLDEGYVSRILTKFAKTKLLTRAPDSSDTRRSIITLTEQGISRAALYVDQARASLENLLSDTSPIDQTRITAAMSDIKTAFSGENPKVTFRDIQTGDIGWLIEHHAVQYQAEEGFDHTFEALVAEILADFLRNRNPKTDRAFIAVRDGQRLGSVFCIRQSDDIAKLRLYSLVPEARGLGIGKQLLELCITYARDQGHKKLILWTHKSHQAACALYAKYDFKMTSEEPVHEFGVDLIRQNWELTL